MWQAPIARLDHLRKVLVASRTGLGLGSGAGIGGTSELAKRVEGLIDKAELHVKRGAHFDARMVRALLFRRYGKYSGKSRRSVATVRMLPVLFGLS